MLACVCQPIDRTRLLFEPITPMPPVLVTPTSTKRLKTQIVPIHKTLVSHNNGITVSPNSVLKTNLVVKSVSAKDVDKTEKMVSCSFFCNCL